MNIPDQYTSWVQAASALGFTDFITPEDGFRACIRSGGQWRNSACCGIYFWIADNGETYVGQTVNARARLREHWRNHPDLSYACFQPVVREELDAREVQLIDLVGRRFPTRNIKFALETQTHVPFDRFVSRDERAAFLDGAGDLPDRCWRELPVLEQKQARKFQQLLGDRVGPDVINTLAIYIDKVIPRPAATEARFWSVTLFAQHLMRVNAGQQEVFTLTNGTDGGLYARPLTTTPFGPDAEGPFYKSSSYDAWFSAEKLSTWLTDKRLVSCRELVVRLMRHTTTLNSGSHCPQVVRAALPQS